MAVTASAPGTAVTATRRAGRPARLRHFATLRLRLLLNSFRGRPGRVVAFVIGLLAGLYMAAMGFTLATLPVFLEPREFLLATALGGALLVVGSVLLPLVWFGVDDTLDPARLALLPIPRGRLIAGLLVAAALGIPGICLVLATSGLVISAAAHAGVAGALVQAVGVVLGAAVCLTAGRAVTSAFASVMRSRRARDLAWVLIAVVAASIGPLQLAVMPAVERADWDRLAKVAEWVAWTPLAAPYTVGADMALGRPLAAVGKLLVAVATVAALLWWWSRTVESAQAGAVAVAPAKSDRRRTAGGAVAQLLPRALPLRPTPVGAVVARELRFMWRDTKRRANLIMVPVVGLFTPVLILLGGGRSGLREDGFVFTLGRAQDVSPLTLMLTMMFVSAFVALIMANQFGYDGTAFSGHLVVHVPGRVDLAGRAVAYSIYLVPLLLVVGAVVAVMLRSPAAAPATWGVLLATYGTGVAVSMVVSVVGAYPLPETGNPFATGSGGAVLKSLLALVGVVASWALAVPVTAAALLLPEAWPWIAVPVGAGYGLAAAVLSARLTGRLLDRRGPEVLAQVTPRR